MASSATVELGVSELILSSSASTCRRAKVRVMTPGGMTSAPSLETPTVAAVAAYVQGLSECVPHFDRS